MSNELAEFGIKVTSIEPGYFRSNILAESNRSEAKNIIQDYEGDTAARRGVAFHNRVELEAAGRCRQGVQGDH